MNNYEKKFKQFLKEGIEEKREERPSIAFSDKHYDKEVGDKLRKAADDHKEKMRKLGKVDEAVGYSIKPNKTWEEIKAPFRKMLGDDSLDTDDILSALIERNIITLDSLFYLDNDLKDIVISNFEDEAREEMQGNIEESEQIQEAAGDSPTEAVEEYVANDPSQEPYNMFYVDLEKKTAELIDYMKETGAVEEMLKYTDEYDDVDSFLRDVDFKQVFMYINDDFDN